MSTPLQSLFESLNRRLRPEDAAELVLDVLGKKPTRSERALLDAVASGSLRRKAIAYTSMAQDFARPVGAIRQVQKAGDLFARATPLLTPEECDDPGAILAFAERIGPEIRKAFGASNFDKDRLNGEAREAAGLDLSRRQYNKRFRLLQRLEAKLATLAQETQKREFTIAGKSGFASRLTWDEFARDPNAACFIGFYTARCNLRSEFTISRQERPFDTVAEMLLARCERAATTTNWWAISHVLPRADVLARLSDAEKGQLLGMWFALLQSLSSTLHRLFEASQINRATMIVKRGDDSTTWNNVASAWNKARANWIALLDALGMDALLDALCPGKVPRLMAADVAYWHRSAGGGLHPDTVVWNALPLPWEVLRGEAACGRSLVEQVCAAHGVDPVKNGWSAPRPPAQAVPFRPTPELVHGVAVGDPFLASVLKQAGVFSGKPLRLANLKEATE